ncbi:hypothetical protein DGG96_09045 [Legionella qingyii]|uniref:Uncharacterized protein n=1 Tax=Legionella qingyii TaxID=2184757 RepID=A0A317U6E3_9GAMM|nr:hypothetical protein DGG96_09045 [Legionella qingyii]
MVCKRNCIKALKGVYNEIIIEKNVDFDESYVLVLPSKEVFVHELEADTGYGKIKKKLVCASSEGSYCKDN